MKTIKIVVTQVLKVPDTWGLEKEPGGEFKCLKAGRKFYDAGIMWLEYKEGLPEGAASAGPGDTGYWVEDMGFMEEVYDRRMVSEISTYKEVKA